MLIDFTVIKPLCIVTKVQYKVIIKKEIASLTLPAHTN